MSAKGGSMSTYLQNVLRKRNKKDIPNLRLLEDGEGPHIPTTNYCGPKTNLASADAHGPTSEVDKVCQKHDYAYKRVEDNAADLTKEEKYDLIHSADKQMLHELDSLPNSTEKRLAQAGIKAKSTAEGLTGRLLYGGSIVEPGAMFIESKPEVIAGGVLRTGGCGGGFNCPKCSAPLRIVSAVDGGAIQLVKQELTGKEGLDKLVESMGSTIDLKTIKEYEQDSDLQMTIRQRPSEIKDILRKKELSKTQLLINDLATRAKAIEELRDEVNNIPTDARTKKFKDRYGEKTTEEEKRAIRERKADLRERLKAEEARLDAAKKSASTVIKDIETEIALALKGIDPDKVRDPVEDVKKILRGEDDIAYITDDEINKLIKVTKEEEGKTVLPKYARALVEVRDSRMTSDERERRLQEIWDANNNAVEAARQKALVEARKKASAMKSPSRPQWKN